MRECAGVMTIGSGVCAKNRQEDGKNREFYSAPLILVTGFPCKIMMWPLSAYSLILVLHAPILSKKSTLCSSKVRVSLAQELEYSLKD